MAQPIGGTLWTGVVSSALTTIDSYRSNYYGGDVHVVEKKAGNYMDGLN